MKCESCNINPVTITLSKDSGDGIEIKPGIWDSERNTNPYCLCNDCTERIKKLALRPLEVFNLVAIHGHTYLLHDDFYDFDTGMATQPEIPLVDVDKFPLPNFETIKNDLNSVIDFAFFPYFIEDTVIRHLHIFNKDKILKRIDEKITYNRDINYRAYEIIAHVVGRKAEAWIKKEWTNRQKDEFYIFAEPIAKCLDFKEAFKILTTELEQNDDKFLYEHIDVLTYLQHEKVLDWITHHHHRIKNVTSSWGHLAASSQFSWEIAHMWLTMGRPLSLVALDALILCTTKGKRSHQSLWMRKLNPSLLNAPNSKIIIETLQDYLTLDRVPRVRMSIERIIENIT